MEVESRGSRLNLAPLPEVARLIGLKPSAVRDLAYHSLQRITKKGELVPANGFASAFVKIGHRIYGDLDELDRLLEARRLAPKKLDAPATIRPPYPPVDDAKKGSRAPVKPSLGRNRHPS